MSGKWKWGGRRREMDVCSGYSVCLMHSPYRLFISCSQSPSSSLPHPHAGQPWASEGGGWKSDCSGEWRKIEHPLLFCQSVSSFNRSSKRCLLHGVPLTCLCKRFSLGPKGGECWGPDKVPRMPDGSCQTERGM